MPQPQHFSDYGFDPQIHYFQILEEARKQKRETSRSIDSLHFKLQKPISKDDSKKSKKERWWKNAFVYIKLKWRQNVDDRDEEDVHGKRARVFRASLSGPVYITESRSGSNTPSRPTNRHSSDIEIPYLSLRELNMEHQQQRVCLNAMPLYLVT